MRRVMSECWNVHVVEVMGCLSKEDRGTGTWKVSTGADSTATVRKELT